LEDTAARIRTAIQDRDVDTTGPWNREIVTLLRFDAPNAAALVEQTVEDPAKLVQAADRIDELLSSWPGDAGDTAIYVGRLTRLVDTITYQLYLGDAWTDPAEVEMIPLPVIEPRLTPVAPDYAKAAATVDVDPSVRHLSVLEGSEVKVSVECTNKKRLTSAWLIVTSEEEPHRYSLSQQDSEGFVWSLDNGETPFSQVTREIRFEIQVTDEDDLHLEAPIRGYIRIKADRPPYCEVQMLYTAVHPTNSKQVRVWCRSKDDYGVARESLLLRVERVRDDDREEGTDTQRTYDLTKGELPAVAPKQDRLPEKNLAKSGFIPYELDLSSLSLRVGDRLSIALQAVDYRGEMPGAVYQSDAKVLEVGGMNDELYTGWKKGESIIVEGMELEEGVKRALSEIFDIGEPK